jgi:hypothetical protein
VTLSVSLVVVMVLRDASHASAVINYLLEFAVNSLARSVMYQMIRYTQFALSVRRDTH